MTPTDEEIKALVERLRETTSEEVVSTAANHDIHAAADALETLSAQVAELRLALSARDEQIDKLLHRTIDAEKRLAEVQAERKAKDEQYWLAAENEAKLQDDRDQMESALRRQIENIERWLETGEPASPEESRSIYEQLKAALSGSSEPRKDVARRCVEIAQSIKNTAFRRRYWQNAVEACDSITAAISSEFSLDTKEGK